MRSNRYHYHGNFPDPRYQRMVSMALALFNDVIIQVAMENRLRILDLRTVCNSPVDYANPIEPSSTGGAKIAEAIIRAVTAPCASNHSFHEVSRVVPSKTRAGFTCEEP